MLLEPRAKHLSEFRHLVELLTAIRDIVDGAFSRVHDNLNDILSKSYSVIENIYAKGYIHRDISIANVMLEPTGDEFRGLLIDYDYAIHIARVSKGAAGRRTVSERFAIDH